jgi:hypothetical protein
MSETEQKIGTLTEVCLLSDHDAVYDLIRECGKEVTRDSDFRKFISEDLYDEYVIYDDRVYAVNMDSDYGDIMYARQRSDGQIDFVLEYYNGGCCFSEAIEEALENIKE